MDIERLRAQAQVLEELSVQIQEISNVVDYAAYVIDEVLNDIEEESETESIDDKVDKAFIQSDFEYLLIHNDDFREAMKSGGSAAVGWIKANPSLLYSIYKDTTNTIENK